jgi:glutathione peroxidase
MSPATPQYAGLRTLHEQHDGLTVMGFPCNQFGAQEPGTDAEILEFATSNYQVNFPLFSKIEVNGEGACQLYQMLTAAQPDDDGKHEIAWNFTKFLVDGEGDILARFSPKITPEEIGETLADYGIS